MSRCMVGDVMTTNVVSARTDASFREIVDLLQGKGISAVPVVDSGNLVLGVISEADLLAKIVFAGGSERPRLFEGARIRTARGKAAGDTAEELMSTPAVTVLAHTPVSRAAKLMQSQRVRHLPVVNLAGRLIGIVAQRDLLSVFLRSDVTVAEDVRRALAQVPGVPPEQVTVDTIDGVVRLSGKLDRRSLVPELIRITRGVDGVVDVVSHLSFRQDDVIPVPAGVP
jgi:CBS domain-containing protein